MVHKNTTYIKFSKPDTAFLFCTWLTYAWKHDIRIWAAHHKHLEERLSLRKTTP